MTSHRERSRADSPAGDGGRNGSDERHRPECIGNACHAGGRRTHTFDGIEHGHRPEAAADGRWLRAYEDGGPVFGSGDEEVLRDLEDADSRIGAAAAIWVRGNARHGRLHPRGDKTWLPDADGGNLRFARRRAEERALDFLGGADASLHLGDGEDLP